MRFRVFSPFLFLLTQPFLSIVLFALAWTVGFVTHYILPQLRKHHPWLWISHPVLKNKEYRQREVRGMEALVLLFLKVFYPPSKKPPCLMLSTWFVTKIV